LALWVGGTRWGRLNLRLLELLRNRRRGWKYHGPGPLGPDLLSRKCDHIQGPIHEAPVQHLGTTLTHHRVVCPMVGSDVLGGGDGVSHCKGRKGIWDGGGSVGVRIHTGDGARRKGSHCGRHTDQEGVHVCEPRQEVVSACVWTVVPKGRAVTGRDAEEGGGWGNECRSRPT
jgi:hypothetical protein